MPFYEQQDSGLSIRLCWSLIDRRAPDCSKTRSSRWGHDERGTVSHGSSRFFWIDSLGRLSGPWSLMPALLHVHRAEPQPIQQSRHAGSRVLSRLVQNAVVEGRLGNLLLGKLANLGLQVGVGGYQ